MDSPTALLYNKSLRFLSFRPRSVYEMKNYLQKNKASETQIQEIIQKLSGLNFLNDLSFAQKWVEDRKKSHPRSLSILKLELRQKGISPEIFEEVLKAQKENEEDFFMAKSIIEKILLKTNYSNDSALQNNPTLLKKKLVSRLQSKGFSWDTIKTAIDESLKKE